MSYMIERGIIYLFCVILLIFLLAGCGTALSPYVCQQVVTGQGRPVLVCTPISPDQISDHPVTVPRPGKPDERT